VLQMKIIRKTGLSALLTLSLAACAGSAIPTPPGTIGESPASIMDSQPPAIDYTDSNQQTALDDSTNGLPPATSLANSNTAQAPSVGYKAPASSAILTFEPMVGAPKDVARELSKSLGLRIAQQSLPVVARTDQKVTHRIKGYFSASKSGSDCVVSYVWDIFDANGKRINRVTGSQKTAMVSSDPWDSVKGPVLDKVSVDTAAKLKTWHASI
ncbi:hypothetical protein, partial [Cohaesibacter celericrescens]